MTIIPYFFQFDTFLNIISDFWDNLEAVMGKVDGF